jgi:hypothetical protein
MLRFLILSLSITGIALLPRSLRAQGVSADTIPDSLAVVSARAPEELRQAGLRYQGAVRACYEREGLRQDPSLAGSIEIGMTIQPQGTVSDVSIDTLDVRGVGMGEVAACVAGAASTWHFSEGPYAAERSVLAFTFIAPGEHAPTPGAPRSSVGARPRS